MRLRAHRSRIWGIRSPPAGWPARSASNESRPPIVMGRGVGVPNPTGATQLAAACPRLGVRTPCRGALSGFEWRSTATNGAPALTEDLVADCRRLFCDTGMGPHGSVRQAVWTGYCRHSSFYQLEDLAHVTRDRLALCSQVGKRQEVSGDGRPLKHVATVYWFLGPGTDCCR
jgi:hypothetical protein